MDANLFNNIIRALEASRSRTFHPKPTNIKIARAERNMMQYVEAWGLERFLGMVARTTLKFEEKSTGVKNPLIYDTNQWSFIRGEDPGTKQESSPINQENHQTFQLILITPGISIQQNQEPTTTTPPTASDPTLLQGQQLLEPEKMTVEKFASPPHDIQIETRPSSPLYTIDEKLRNMLHLPENDELLDLDMPGLESLSNIRFSHENSSDFVLRETTTIDLATSSPGKRACLTENFNTISPTTEKRCLVKLKKLTRRQIKKWTKRRERKPVITENRILSPDQRVEFNRPLPREPTTPNVSPHPPSQPPPRPEQPKSSSSFAMDRELQHLFDNCFKGYEIATSYNQNNNT